MNERTYDAVQETIYEQKLDNGLHVFLLPKKEVAKTYGIFMTNYGSVDRTFIPIEGEKAITVPDGIAHFLEHKLFEKEDRDVFADFLRQGASPNAYTSFTKTAYLFSATKMIEENVRTLLDFVQDPYFSEASVEKEKGIIAQEIKMYDDQPDWQAFMGTIKNMFKNNPVNIDIAGTVSSIDTITKDDLYTCYRTFYHPANMVLFVAGNFDSKAMMEAIEQNQKQKDFPSMEEIKKNVPEEPAHVVTTQRAIHLPVSIPKAVVGIKESSRRLGPEQFLKHETIQGMLLDYFFSPSGPFYEKLYEEHLIDDSFEYSTTVEEDFSFSLISTNTDKPDEFANRVKQLLLGTAAVRLSEETLEVMKRKRIGQLLRGMNALEFTANQFINYHFAGIDFFELFPYIQQLTLDEVNEFLTNWIEEERLTSLKIVSD